MEMEQPIFRENRQAQCLPLVLVVDDDETHQRLIQLLADRLGITAYTASSCAEGIEALQMLAFDIILMDYRMPEVDGCLCSLRIRAMKELRGDIPIIAVTAHVNDD